MSNIVLLETVGKSVEDFSRAKTTADTKTGKALDDMHAGGLLSTDTLSPNTKADNGSTASPELYDGLKSCVVAGFSAYAQKLLKAPTKSLSDVDKSAKNYWQKQIGARLNDIRKGLERREGKADERAPQQPKSPEDKIRTMLESIEKVVQGSEGLTFDAADFLKRLRDLNRMIK